MPSTRSLEFSRRFLLPALVISMLAAARGLAQPPTWLLVNLHPIGAESSQAFGVSGAAVVGYFSAYARPPQAAYWGADYVAKTLPGGSGTWPTGINGATIVGYLRGADAHALMWPAQDQAPVRLEPAGASASYALATDGASQVGSIDSHAVIWHGAPASIVDVHPVSAWASTLRAVDRSGVAGDIILAAHGPPHAAIWQGAGDSVVDLHPAGAYASQGQAISNGRQGGYVQYERDGTYYPAVWSGTAESFVNFSAPGAPTDAGIIYGMDGNVQVGGARFLDGSGGATIWFGTPESAFNLASLLSSDYTRSEARAVDIDEFGTIRVVGYAYNENYYLPNGTYYPRNEAMMWVLVPEPSSLVALAAGLAVLAGVRPRRRR